MDTLFDPSTIAIRRRRAARQMTQGADFLLAHIAADIAERLSVVERHFENAAELHGHTGLTAKMLRATGKIGHLVRVEAEASLLAGELDGIIAPVETVPLEPESQNLIVSPASLHLTNDTPGMFVQIRRALKPDGLFLAAIPAAGTLEELRQSLLQAEDEVTGGASPRVIPFADVRSYGALLQRAGFTLPVADTETLTVRYDTPFHLIRDLRAMGMTSPLEAGDAPPLGRRVLARFAEIYAERFSDPDGRLRATFNFVHLSGWAPHESQQKPLKPGSAQARLADVLGTTERGT